MSLQKKREGEKVKEQDGDEFPPVTQHRTASALAEILAVRMSSSGSGDGCKQFKIPSQFKSFFFFVINKNYCFKSFPINLADKKHLLLGKKKKE